MKKKIVIGLICLSSLMGLSLFLTSRISDAYATATSHILSDPAVEREYGAQRYAVLVGSSFKLGPRWSCATLRFVLDGAKRLGVVKVTLRREEMREAWTVLDISKGYWTRPKVNCGPAA